MASSAATASVAAAFNASCLADAAAAAARCVAIPASMRDNAASSRSTSGNAEVSLVLEMARVPANQHVCGEV
jgi:hypothetical protein